MQVRKPFYLNDKVVRRYASERHFYLNDKVKGYAGEKTLLFE